MEDYKLICKNIIFYLETTRMQKLIHSFSFMSSNDGNVDSPNVSPERRQRIKQINKLSLNPNQLSNSASKAKQGGTTLEEGTGNDVMHGNQQESAEITEGEVLVEHFRFDESQARDGHASYLEEKALFCDLLNSQRPGNAFTQARNSQDGKGKDQTPARSKLSLSFHTGSLKTTSLAKEEKGNKKRKSKDIEMVDLGKSLGKRKG